MERPPMTTIELAKARLAAAAAQRERANDAWLLAARDTAIARAPIEREREAALREYDAAAAALAALILAEIAEG